jgi:ADP-ribose pyrophosphatase
MLYFKYIYMIKLKEKLIKSKNVFNDKLLKVYQDEVQLPNGKSSTRKFIKRP